MEIEQGTRNELEPEWLVTESGIRANIFCTRLKILYSAPRNLYIVHGNLQHAPRIPYIIHEKTTLRSQIVSALTYLATLW